MRNSADTGLNLAVVNFLLQCAATRSIDAMTELGLAQDEIKDLLEMTGEDMARLSMCQDKLFNVTIEKKTWDRVKRSVLDVSCQLRNELLCANAPRSMIGRWWPMSHRVFTHLRETLTKGTGQTLRRQGRPRRATAEEEETLWASWAEKTRTRNVRDLGPKDYLDMHNETAIELMIIWTLTNEWAAEGLYGADRQTARFARG